MVIRSRKEVSLIGFADPLDDEDAEQCEQWPPRFGAQCNGPDRLKPEGVGRCVSA